MANLQIDYKQAYVLKVTNSIFNLDCDKCIKGNADNYQLRKPIQNSVSVFDTPPQLVNLINKDINLINPSYSFPI